MDGNISANRADVRELLIRDCQILGGELDASPQCDATRVESLIASLPIETTIVERAVIRTVMVSTIGRLITKTGIDRNPEVISAFIVWTASSPTTEEWRSDIQRLAATIGRFLAGRASAPVGAAYDTRVARALSIIEERYRHPRLGLVSIAAECALSPSRLVRLLQAQTGAGFSEHVHRRRMIDARERLATNALSIKEIAATVGYGSSTHFARCFMRLYGQSPIAFRRAAQSTSTIRNR